MRCFKSTHLSRHNWNPDVQPASNWITTNKPPPLGSLQFVAENVDFQIKKSKIRAEMASSPGGKAEERHDTAQFCFSKACVELNENHNHWCLGCSGKKHKSSLTFYVLLSVWPHWFNEQLPLEEETLQASHGPSNLKFRTGQHVRC